MEVVVVVVVRVWVMVKWFGGIEESRMIVRVDHSNSSNVALVVVLVVVMMIDEVMIEVMIEVVVVVGRVMDYCCFFQ